MQYRDPEEKNIKNDFAKNMGNECFSVNDIIDCIKGGFMRMSKLPPDIADRVQEELNLIKTMNETQIKKFTEKGK